MGYAEDMARERAEAEAKTRAKTIRLVKMIASCVLGLILIMVLFGSFEVISPDERAVKVTLGTVSPNEYGPGVQLKLPIASHFESVSIKPVTRDVVIDVGENGAISSDNQTLGVSAKVAWRYDTARVMELVTKYPNRSTLENLIDSTAYEALKAEIGKYTIFDLSKSAGKIASDALAAANAKVKDYPVVIMQVNLTNWDWDDSFDRRIKDTMEAQQKVAQAKADADRIEQEQRAQTITAEATARSLIATATGEKEAAELRAEAKKAEGQGIADYNRLIAQNLEIEIKFRTLEIERLKAEKWNGAYVPEYVPLTAAGGIVNLPVGAGAASR